MEEHPHPPRFQPGSFFSQHWLGRLLAFLSLPLVLLVVLFWPNKQKIPIVDMQMHYNQDAWGLYQPSTIAATLEELEVVMAAVASTPNEGTFKLLDQAPERIKPFFQPYRTAEDRDIWLNDPAVLELIEREARHWRYAGIGEIHLPDHIPDTPALRRLLEIAQDRQLYLSVHARVEGIHQLFAIAPAQRVLWGHAGMTATPEVISEMLETYPTLVAELSHRLDIAPNGKLDPAWRELFEKHPMRLMLGSGTYSNEFWYQFRYTLGRFRDWLEQLPPQIAERIAYRNALEILGDTRM